MDWADETGSALETLAANILLLFVGNRINKEGLMGVALAQSLASRFAAEALAEMPECGACIPQDAVLDWLSDQF